jgi:hypothetical protein
VRRLIHAFVVVLVLASSGSIARAQAGADGDGDGLPDAWEIAFGLDPQSAAAPHGATSDPDGDGVSNRDEYTAGTHPRSFYTRRLAEGVDNSFFSWQLALGNPETTDAHVLVEALLASGATRRLPVVVAARSRRTLTAADLGVAGQEFGVEVSSDVAIGADRVMTWAGVGSHAEGAIPAPARQWYLAEGATGGPFSLFYLLQNTSNQTAAVTVRYLRPAPDPPIDRSYSLPPRSRYTIWVDAIEPLAATDVSAVITANQDIAVERAMYFDDATRPFVAGHAASAVIAPAPEWFLAEGATGPFFDEFILLANPSTTAAEVQIDYLLADGMVIPKKYALAPESRLTIRVDYEHGWLVNAAVSARLRTLNGVPFIAERTMWWADGGWYEAHNSPGATTTGTRWLISAGEVGGPAHYVTYVLLANPSPVPGQARVTILFEGGGTATQTFAVAANSRFNVDVGSLFPATEGRRFSTLVESLGTDPAELVVEWSLYGTPGARPWEFGANALATNLSSPLRTLTDLTLFRGQGAVTVDAFRAIANAGAPVFSVASSSPSVATVTIDPATGRLSLAAGSNPGTTTITVSAQVPGQPVVTESFVLTVPLGRTVTFAPSQALGGSWLFPAWEDVDGDGRVELAGTRNVNGQLVPQDLRAIGLGSIVDRFPTWDNRDNRLVDLNGDGRLDLVTWAYTPVSDATGIGRLFLGRADGSYVEDPAFAALDIRGYGHTIVAGDYDNDGDSDLFLIEYTHNDPREQFYLLLNDGAGRFTDVADAAGVATRGWPIEHKSEGAQAADVDGDGDLDLYAASHFYFNQGVVDGIPRFVDRRAALGLPLRFDEGLKFLDFDNDGRLDLLVHHPSEGPQLWRAGATGFTLVPLPTHVFDKSYGANVADMNGDGFEDLILAPGTTTRTWILLNTGRGTFVENPLSNVDGTGGDVMAFGDADGDGRIDLGRRGSDGLDYLRNTTAVTGLNRLVIEVVGDNGEHNQHGRVVRVVPTAAPGVTYTRVVDGGSSFVTQNQYPLLVGTPYAGAFTVSVRFDHGTVTFTMNAGERRRVFRTGQIVPIP